MNNLNTEYLLQNVATGRIFEDEGWLLDDPQAESPSLIRTLFKNKRINIDNGNEGIYKFADWMPVCKTLSGSDAPLTYKSDGLAKFLGLENLYIIFNGYFPEKGVKMKSCSFKETEAYTVCARPTPCPEKVLVISSVGNTARAFAKVCSENNIPLLLCVSESYLDNLWFETPLNDCVKLITTELGSDYFDSINLGNITVKSNKFYAEGGAKNVARRDGMGTTILSAVSHIGKIPDYYFQAIGSGTGAIAAWEANMRFIEDGRFGSNKMKLMLSQNAPFLPMFEAWHAKSRSLLQVDDMDSKKQICQIHAKVLSNRRPPYSVSGGLYDAMMDAGGTIFSVENQDAINAAHIFEDMEKIDIMPAAAVATASLIYAVKKGIVKKDEYVALNITGGGEKLFKSDKKIHYLKSSHTFSANPSENEVLEVIDRLF